MPIRLLAVNSATEVHLMVVKRCSLHANCFNPEK